MIYKITELVKSVPFSTKQVRSLLTGPVQEQGSKYVPKELSIKDFIKYEKNIYRSTAE